MSAAAKTVAAAAATRAVVVLECITVVVHSPQKPSRTFNFDHPADSAKVRMSWSGDAANYYSTAGGHKQGDARQAASVI